MAENRRHLSASPAAFQPDAVVRGIESGRRKALKTATLQQLRNRPGELFRGAESILITRRGKVIGYVQPWPGMDERIPLAVRRRTFKTSVAKTARQLAAKGVTEEQIERDIEALRKNRR